MSEAKFTAGPWTLELVQEWPFGVRIVAASGKRILSESADAHATEQKTRLDCETGVGFDSRTERANGITRDQVVAIIAEQDANARLMSSAPCLLEALQEILAVFGEHPPAECFGSDKNYREAIGAWASAHAAIAKATGKEVA
jgi:hypothetical protein